MADWLSYGLSDFLLFSPRAYWRLFELHNAAWWPLPLATLAAGAVALGLAILRCGPRWIAFILALLWAWVAWSFFGQRYAEINWAAFYVAPVFALQAALLALAARQGVHASDRRLAGLSLAVLAVLIYPLLAPALGRDWQSAEVFGMAPDPTAIATLGFALLWPGRWRAALLPIPLLWCVASGVTLLALQAAEAWIVLGAATLAVAASVLPKGR